MRIVKIVVALMLCGSLSFILAAGTASGTSITNTATLGYAVGGVTQTYQC